ncbi:MAG: TlpA family protein disulfide reductase [Anaerolineae bacterium]|nr:TlpA family protein disulfide reductase [Anaerolineae bacterium]
MAHLSLNLVKILVVLLVAISSISSYPTTAQAQDKATEIYKLARQVHEQNLEYEGYTYWVLGDLGAPENAQRPQGLKPGRKLPAFSFTEFDGTKKFTDKTLKPPYMINFWASWCVPCRLEFPMLSEAIESGDLGVPVYFVNTGELSKSDARLFLLTYAGDITVLTDSRSKFGNQVGLNFIPVTIVVDADGNIQALQPGGLTELTLKFFELIAANPGVGGFDRNNPDKMPTPKN